MLLKRSAQLNNFLIPTPPPFPSHAPPLPSSSPAPPTLVHPKLIFGFNYRDHAGSVESLSSHFDYFASFSIRTHSATGSDSSVRLSTKNTRLSCLHFRYGIRGMALRCYQISFSSQAKARPCCRSCQQRLNDNMNLIHFLDWIWIKN